jgi:hypothetical protein
MNESQPQYKVSYVYENPSPAGPFKGRTVLDYKPAKGDQIRAMFGAAIVRTVSKAK